MMSRSNPARARLKLLRGGKSDPTPPSPGAPALALAVTVNVPSARFEEWLCLECRGALNVVISEGRERWLCPGAVGEVVFDREIRVHRMPEGAVHSAVRFYRAEDLALFASRRQVERVDIVEISERWVARF